MTKRPRWKISRGSAWTRPGGGHGWMVSDRELFTFKWFNTGTEALAAFAAGGRS